MNSMLIILFEQNYVGTCEQLKIPTYTLINCNKILCLFSSPSEHKQVHRCKHKTFAPSDYWSANILVRKLCCHEHNDTKCAVTAGDSNAIIQLSYFIVHET